MTFEEAYKLTDTISAELAFDREESSLYFDLLMGLPDHSRVLEIGCQYGRSTSILAQVAKEKHFEIHLVDDYNEAESLDAMICCLTMLHEVGVNFNLHRMKSALAAIEVSSQDIALTLIDGDHSYTGVISDIVYYGSISELLVLHDFGRESLPDIRQAWTHSKAVQDFIFIEQRGTLAAFRKKSD